MNKEIIELILETKELTKDQKAEIIKEITRNQYTYWPHTNYPNPYTWWGGYTGDPIIATPVNNTDTPNYHQVSFGLNDVTANLNERSHTTQ